MQQPNEDPVPLIHLQPSPEQKAAYSVGTVLGHLYPSLDPLVATWFYMIGALGERYRYAHPGFGPGINNPFWMPLEYRKGAKVAYYTGVGVGVALSTRNTPPGGAADWFRWGMQLGRINLQAPFLFTDPGGAPFITPITEQQFQQYPIYPARRQAYALGFSITAASAHEAQPRTVEYYTLAYVAARTTVQLRQGDTAIDIIAYMMGRAQRKTYNQAATQWFLWGLQAGEHSPLLYVQTLGVFPPYEALLRMSFPMDDQDTPSDEESDG